MGKNIHSTAVIDPEVELPENVEVGPYAIIEKGVRIGNGSRLLARAHLCTGSTLGEECTVHMGAVIGNTPQHLAFKGEATQTIIGDRVTIRENVTIHRSTGEGTQTIVGDDCYLMVGSHVAHNCILRNGVTLANGALLAGHVEVDDHALISGNVVIHQFVRIGRHTILSGGSRFGMDVPPYLIGDGTNTVTNLNSIGLRRSKNFSDEDRTQVRAAFKILYRINLDLPDALERLRKEFSSEAVRSWIRFLENPSPRGFCHYRSTRRR